MVHRSFVGHEYTVLDILCAQLCAQPLLYREGRVRCMALSGLIVGWKCSREQLRGPLAHAHFPFTSVLSRCAGS